jgi:NitT/TauT family transport system ATP-binding protein
MSVASTADVKISCRGVTKSYGSTRAGVRPLVALDEVSFDVAQGEIFSLVGPTGCGKSSSLNLVAGFETPTVGEVLVNGRIVDGPGSDRAVVFQQAALFPWMSVFDNVVLGVKSQGMPKAEYTARANELLAAVGLEKFHDHYPYQLSGGMQQRTQIARALISRPQVLLTDEPFGALDYQPRLLMQELLLRLWEQFNPTIFFITHDVSEAIFISDTVAVMSARPGRLKLRIPVPFPKPRTLEFLTTPEFGEMEHQVLAAVQEEFASAYASQRESSR